jgi:uncharacterized lipoprotein NlpE involved in copper resistance
MKMVIIALVGVTVGVVGIACNNNNSAAGTSQVKSVDSAAAAAPDTIKTIALDSAVRRDSVHRDSVRRDGVR